MKLEQAIQRLQEDINLTGDDALDALSEAEQLGIEALKRVKAYKEAHIALPYTPMPGETPE